MKKLLVLLLVVVAGLAAWAYWLNQPVAANGEEGFTFDRVQYGELTETINASGNFKPRDIVPVGSELAGRVVKLYPNADFNMRVKKGEPLLQLDSKNAELTLERGRDTSAKAKDGVAAAQRRRDAAQVTFNLKQKLARQSLIPDSEAEGTRLQLKAAEIEVDAAERTVQEAEAAVHQAEYALSLMTVKAPVTGTILDRKVSEGQLIAPPISGQLFTIAEDMSKMRFHAQVSETDIARVRVGQEARFTVLAYSNADTNSTFQPIGRVFQIRVTPVGDGHAAGAIYYEAIIEVENKRDPDKGWMLLPGMTASVDIVLRVHRTVWKMPMAVLNLQLDEHYQTPAAKNKLHEWESKPDSKSWVPVWIMGPDKKPWPIFVRLAGTDQSGAQGTSDTKFREVVDWDPEIKPKLDPKNPDRYPQVIISAPPVRKAGFLDQLKFKIS